MNKQDKKTILSSFNEHSVLLSKTLAVIENNILHAVNEIVNTFESGGKVVLFGNGGSAAHAQHLSAEFIGKFLKERKSLPSLALTTNESIATAIGNDNGFDNIFQRQVESLVNANDLIIAISTSGNSINVIKGVQAARKKGAKVIAFSGNYGGKLALLADVLIDIPSESTPRIQELQLLAGHIICELVEKRLFD